MRDSRSSHGGAETDTVDQDGREALGFHLISALRILDRSGQHLAAAYVDHALHLLDLSTEAEKTFPHDEL